LYGIPSVTLEHLRRMDDWTDRFFDEVVTSDNIVFDRFLNPSSRLGWARRQNALGYGSIARFNAEGVRLFTTIGLDSLRTAAVEAMPLDLWQDRWEGRFGNLIAWTVGNPEEEQVSITSVGYSAVRWSWETGNDYGGVQWGFRPWRTNPYIYLLARAGHLDGRPLITLEGRAGYTLLGTSRLEGRLTVQLPESFRIAGLATFNPARMVSGEFDGTHIGIALEKAIDSHKFTPGGVFYVGFRSGAVGDSSNRRFENLFLAGFTRQW
jgi:hypothetical protein